VERRWEWRKEKDTWSVPDSSSNRKKKGLVLSRIQTRSYFDHAKCKEARELEAPVRVPSLGERGVGTNCQTTVSCKIVSDDLRKGSSGG